MSGLFDVPDFDDLSSDDEPMVAPRPVLVEEKRPSRISTDADRNTLSTAMDMLVIQARNCIPYIETIKRTITEKDGKSKSVPHLDLQSKEWISLFPEFQFCYKHDRVTPSFVSLRFGDGNHLVNEDCGLCNASSSDNGSNIDWTMKSLDASTGVSELEIRNKWLEALEELGKSNDYSDKTEVKQQHHYFNKFHILENQCWLRYMSLKYHQASEVRRLMKVNGADSVPLQDRFDMFRHAEADNIRRWSKPRFMLCPEHRMKCNAFPTAPSDRFKPCMHCEIEAPVDRVRSRK